MKISAARIGAIALLAALSGGVSGDTALAAEPSGNHSSPVYMRHRSDHHGGMSRYPDHFPGYQNLSYYPFWGNNFFFPPTSGSWYTRPYPYHFDYYRQRFGGSPTRPTTAQPRP